ncbi:unnamed protein product [Caenorhabditis auriculariae]|uniref:Uncharacterized protein n=1 Tax=Caenorhabditis auriculariae TaxID=2777116 RepID=A0A8S1HGV4_9PELO|nr:unnamed protein product [Caenorhabditis auriculariae]
MRWLLVSFILFVAVLTTDVKVILNVMCPIATPKFPRTANFTLMERDGGVNGFWAFLDSDDKVDEKTVKIKNGTGVETIFQGSEFEFTDLELYFLVTHNCTKNKQVNTYEFPVLMNNQTGGLMNVTMFHMLK